MDYFTEEVRRQAEARFGRDMLYKEGLIIQTTWTSGRSESRKKRSTRVFANSINDTNSIAGCTSMSQKMTGRAPFEFLVNPTASWKKARWWRGW